MPVDNLIPPGESLDLFPDLVIAGQTVKIRRLTGTDTLRLLRVLDVYRQELGLQGKDLQLQLSTQGISEFLGKLLTGLVGEVDLEQEDAQLGPLAKIVYRELRRLCEPRLAPEQVAAAGFDEQAQIIQTMLEQEEGTALGKFVRDIAGRLTSWMTMVSNLATRHLISNPTGPAPIGGTTGSSSPFAEPTAGAMPTY